MPNPLGLMFPQGSVALTIPNGGIVSDALALAGSSLLGFATPAAWTAAALSLEVSIDGTTWLTPYDAYGAAVGNVASPAVSSAYAVDVMSLLPWAFVRFKSSVAQGSDRVITASVRPLA